MTGASDTSVTPADRPLAGLSVVVTRTREQAEALVRPLEALGAEVLAFPVIEVVDPADTAPLEKAVARVGEYDWLVLTSTNGVERFFDRLSAAGASPGEQLAGVSVAAVGSSTAERLRQRGVEPDLVPANFRAEGLVEAFEQLGVCEGCSILIPRAAEAREVLPEQLAALGAHVDAVDLYRLAPTEPDQSVLERVAAGDVDVITFASGATARYFVAALEKAGIDPAAVFSAAKIASVGPVTTAGIRALGYEVSMEARSSTMDALVSEIVRRLGSAA